MFRILNSSNDHTDNFEFSESLFLFAIAHRIYKESGDIIKKGVCYVKCYGCTLYKFWSHNKVNPIIASGSEYKIYIASRYGSTVPLFKTYFVTEKKKHPTKSVNK